MSESEEEFVDFSNITAGTINSPVDPRLLSWCPTMDMVLFTPSQGDGGLIVYRLSGQIVWSVTPRKSQLLPTQIAWRDDGRSFVLLLKDGSCRVYNINNGKLMYNVPLPKENHTWTAITWSQLRISEEAFKSQPFKSIVKYDPLKHLPKLPALQGTASESNVYVQRQVLDEIMHSNMKDPQSFDMSMIFTGSSKGVLSISLFGTFNLGQVQISPPSEVLSITSMKNQTRHLVLSQDENYLYMIPLSVDFVNKYGLYLIDVTVIPVKLLATFEYLKDTLDLIQTEMKSMSFANKEFLTSLSGAIELDQSSNNTDTSKFPEYQPNSNISKSQETSLKAESALLDSLLTGIANRAIEYWLKDLLKEKGIKKWRKLCFNAYDNVRKILFENLLPSCERMLLLLTELRGLSKWSERGIPLGLDAESLDASVEKVSLMAEMANNLIWSLNSQFALFRFFSSWIEILFEEVTGIPLKDPASEAQGPKYTVSSKVVEYITKHIGASINLPEALDLHQSSKNLDSTCESLEESCEFVFAKIKKAMMDQIYSTTALKLISADLDAQAKVRLVEVPEGSFCCVAMCNSGNPLEIIFARFKITGSDPIKAVEVCRVDVNPGPGYAKVQKFQYIDDENFAVLVSAEDAPKRILISLSYSDLLYTVVPYKEGKALAELAKDAVKIPLEIKQSRLFEEDFIPEHFAINQERKVGCLLEQDLQQFIFFDTNGDEYEEDENDE